MFEIEPKIDANLEEFNKQYINVKEMLDYLDKTERKLDLAIKQYDYDSVCELLDFLKLCKSNYATVNLIMALETYVHQLEDEAFLDMYVRIQDDTFNEWLENCSLSDLKKLKSSFQNFNTIYEMFPEVASLVLEKEESYHM